MPEFLHSNATIQIVPVSKGYLELKKAWKIYKYVNENCISVINSFGLKELILSTAIKAFGCWRLKTVHHSVELLQHYGFIQKALLGVLLELSNVVLFNSKGSKKIMKGFSMPEKKIVVIKNGIDTSAFKKTLSEKQDLRIRHNVGENEIVLGTIANFREEKNYPFLLSAFRVLSESHPNLRLICVGGGYLLDEMKELSRSYGLEKKLIFTGYSKDVVRYLSLMDVFVLCSLRESLPNAILQAMSMEIPVISSDVGGCPEIIDNMTNGILYPSNSVEGFIEAVEMLLGDKCFAYRLGVNARRTVKETFSLYRMIEDYSAFYLELSSNTNIR